MFSDNDKLTTFTIPSWEVTKLKNNKEYLLLNLFKIILLILSTHSPGYESVFDKKAFGGELERGELEAFFKECDLYPSQAEIEDAMDVTMRGKYFNAPRSMLC